MAAAGKPKGSINKQTGNTRERINKMMRRMNYCPFEAMMRIGMQAERDEDYALAGNMAKELAQYQAPKLKSVELKAEHSGAVGGNWKVEFINATQDADIKG